MTDGQPESTFDERLQDYLVVLLGCGKMGTALARRWVRSDRLDPRRLVCLDAVEEKSQGLADELDAREAIPEIELDEDQTPIRRMRLYVVAVKPDDVHAVLEPRREEEFTDEDTIVSIAAGVDIDTLRRFAGPFPGIARAMPNTPALVGAGVTGVMGDGTVDMDALKALFESVGKVVTLTEESHFHGLTAISGSGPAYLFTAIEAIADGGVLMGLDRQTAVDLATGVVEGSAKLVAQRRYEHTADLKDAVASPGGTTIAGLVALEEHGFRHALIRAVEAAARRSQELSEEMSNQRPHEDSPLG